MLHVHTFDASALCWSFNLVTPYFRIPCLEHTDDVRVDPHPCYAHDALLVKAELEHCDEVFPLPQDTHIYLLNRERLDRCNADAFTDAVYKSPRRQGIIRMDGKRIPPHPAMTRYLVAHEYGHLAARWLALQNCQDDWRQWEREYAVLRGIPDQPASYGGRTWHLCTSEIVANDFRVLIARREEEFWPHEVPTLREVFHGPVYSFWAEAQLQSWRAAGKIAEVDKAASGEQKREVLAEVKSGD